MRKIVAVLVAAVFTFGLGVPAAFAQAAAPPAPKVTISGLVDFVASVYKNWSGGSAGAGTDVTDGGRDQGAYSRERGVFTITGEIGKSKGVLALEFDLCNGFVGPSSAAGTAGGGQACPGVSASADLDTDVAGISEVKWLYVETPVTGPGSLLPFIPVPSILRGGAQPARGIAYRPGILWSGDFPGVTVETKWAPNLRSTLVYAQLREKYDNVVFSTTESYAWLAAVEVDVFKGLTIKPVYAYQQNHGGAGNTLLGDPTNDGLTLHNTLIKDHRHTFGVEAKWRGGPFSVEPSFFYQTGELGCRLGAQGAGSGCTVDKDIDISAWIVDVIGGFRTGPLNIEGRFIYTSGNDANDRPRNGADIHYFQPINPGFGFFSGWTELWTGGIDYATAVFAGNGGMSMRTSPSYDKYGRVVVALAVDYNLTPALVLHGWSNASWAAHEVDTDTSTLSAAGLTSRSGGDHKYLGTEVGTGLTYRFAPNVAFDLAGGYIFAGDGLNHAGLGATPGREREAEDIWKVASRVRVTW